MEGTIALQRNAVDRIKCALCDNYLSVPPIITISSDGKEYKCGRCKDVNCETFTRNYCFENVAEFLTFPCTYRDCEEKIQWGNVEEHEKTCLYRMISCPLTYRCEIVKVSELEAHFQSKHKVDLRFTYNLTVNNTTVLLQLFNCQLYVAYITFSRINSFVSVFSIAPLKAPKKYSVKLTSATSNSFVKYENQNIIFYDERQHCFSCFKKTCLKKYHPFSQNKMGIDFSNISTSLPYSSILTLLKNPKSVTFEISLEPEDIKTEQVVDHQKAPTPLEPEPKRLTICQKDIECPICQEYMVAPIYTCETGHSICKSCKTKLTTCPTCQAVISDTRCFTLEAISENIEVPCAYECDGCMFLGKIEQVVRHQQSCTFCKSPPA